MSFANQNAKDSADREGAVLFADITGSTPLYQSVGNAVAAEIVNARLAEMTQIVAQHQGTFVKASGDDVLCWFTDAGQALSAALAMLKPARSTDLDVHAGVQWGAFVYRDGDIYGDCVNTAARLCSLAKPKEVLLGEQCFQRLRPQQTDMLTEVSPLQLKGRRETSRLYSLQVATTDATTRFALDQTPVDRPENDAVILFGGQEWHITEGQSLSIGRADVNAVVVPVPSVSRQHATITMTNGLVEFADHSSAGSYVMAPSGEEFAVFRKTVALSGNGDISLAGPCHDKMAPKLRYTIIARSS